MFIEIHNLITCIYDAILKLLDEIHFARFSIKMLSFDKNVSRKMKIAFSSRNGEGGGMQIKSNFFPLIIPKSSTPFTVMRRTLLIYCNDLKQRTN